MSHQVELFGGPRDGELVVVPELVRLLTLFSERPSYTVAVTNDGSPPSASERFDTDIYELMEWREHLVYVHPKVVEGLKRGSAQ